MNHRKTIPVLFLFLLVPVCYSHAQVLRIDHKELSTDTLLGWEGDFEVDFMLNNLQSTKEKEANYLGFKFVSNTSFFDKKNQYYFKNGLRYFRTNEEKFLSRGYSYFRLNWNRKKVIHPESVLQAQFDNIRYLNFRSLAMQGIKYQHLGREEHEFDLGIGVMYEHEEWENFKDDNKVITKDLLKISSYIGWYTDINNRLFISMLTYYQFGQDRDDDVFRQRVSGTLEITDKITEHLSWMVSLNVQYDAAPIVDVAPFLYEIVNGVKLVF